MPILNDDEDEKEISDAMDRVAYAVHVDPDEKYEKYDKDDRDTGKDYKSDIHDDGDDNKDPEEIGD